MDAIIREIQDPVSVLVVSTSISVRLLADISGSVPVLVKLIRIVELAVVARISDSIEIRIILIWIHLRDAIIDSVRDRISVLVEFTGISDSIGIDILLIRI